jgi:putative lipase involved disintegration of autophagic bodies
MVGRLVKAGLVRKTNIRLSEFPRHVVNKSFTLYLELEVVVVAVVAATRRQLPGVLV